MSKDTQQLIELVESSKEMITRMIQYRFEELNVFDELFRGISIDYERVCNFGCLEGCFRGLVYPSFRIYLPMRVQVYPYKIAFTSLLTDCVLGVPDSMEEITNDTVIHEEINRISKSLSKKVALTSLRHKFGNKYAQEIYDFVLKDIIENRL